MHTSANDIISFWFEELEPKQWWVKDRSVDQHIKLRFNDCLKSATKGELFEWRNSPQGRLAEIIVLDQFSRNIYRGTAQAFAQDSTALVLAQECVALSNDLQLTPQQRSFIYMPYMHSESLLIHQEAIRLFTALGTQSNLQFELQHMDIIQRFGRYPHRNKLLKRESSPEEALFLTQPDSSF